MSEGVKERVAEKIERNVINLGGVTAKKIDKKKKETKPKGEVGIQKEKNIIKEKEVKKLTEEQVLELPQVKQKYNECYNEAEKQNPEEKQVEQKKKPFIFYVPIVGELYALTLMFSGKKDRFENLSWIHAIPGVGWVYNFMKPISTKSYKKVKIQNRDELVRREALNRFRQYYSQKKEIELDGKKFYLQWDGSDYLLWRAEPEKKKEESKEEMPDQEKQDIFSKYGLSKLDLSNVDLVRLNLNLNNKEMAWIKENKDLSLALFQLLAYAYLNENDLVSEYKEALEQLMNSKQPKVLFGSFYRKYKKRAEFKNEFSEHFGLNLDEVKAGFMGKLKGKKREQFNKAISLIKGRIKYFNTYVSEMDKTAQKPAQIRTQQSNTKQETQKLKEPTPKVSEKNKTPDTSQGKTKQEERTPQSTTKQATKTPKVQRKETQSESENLLKLGLQVKKMLSEMKDAPIKYSDKSWKAFCRFCVNVWSKYPDIKRIYSDLSDSELATALLVPYVRYVSFKNDGKDPSKSINTIFGRG